MIHQHRRLPIDPEPIFDEQYYTFDSQFTDKQNQAISLVAGIINTIQKIAGMKADIEKVVSIADYVPSVAGLDKKEMKELNDNVDLLTSQYKDTNKTILEIMVDKPTDEQLKQLHLVTAALPSITALTTRVDGVSPTTAIISLYNNFDKLEEIYNLQPLITAVYAMREQIHIAVQQDFIVKMELLTNEDFRNAINGLCYGLDEETGTKVLTTGEYHGLAQIHTLFNYLPELLKAAQNVNSVVINTTPLE